MWNRRSGPKVSQRGTLLPVLGLRADSSVLGWESRIRPFADIDPLAFGTKMLPPYGLRRLAFCAVGCHTTWGRQRPALDVNVTGGSLSYL